MAREYAQLKASIWQDPDFTSLTPHQQLVYLMLSSQATANLAGVMDYLPGRLARFSNGLTAKQVRDAVEALEASRFVFLDDETDEVLVRSMIRTSGAWKTPNSAAAIAGATTSTLSPKIKSVLLSELHRVIGEADDAGKWLTSRDILDDCASSLVKSGINPWGNPYPNPYPNPSPNPSPKGLPGDGDGDGDRDGDTATLRAAGPSLEDLFSDWWSIWKKKKAKGDAVKAYKAALKKIDHDELMAKTRTYWEHVKRNGIDLQYVPYPASWLRAEQWDDDLTTDTPQQQGAVFDPKNWKV